MLNVGIIVCLIGNKIITYLRILNITNILIDLLLKKVFFFNYIILFINIKTNFLFLNNMIKKLIIYLKHNISFFKFTCILILEVKIIIFLL